MQVRPASGSAFVIAASLLVHCSSASVAGVSTSNDQELFRATPFTKRNTFTTGIEGPACDRQGNVYAVNLSEQSTIGVVSSDGQARILIKLPSGSVGNGIRFDRGGTMYIADYVNHNILRIEMPDVRLTVHAHNDSMNQPNDLTISSVGVLFASDPNWQKSTGQIWRIDPSGQTTLVAQDLGTTNGIELSPNDKTLFVNESVQRNLWAFDVTSEGELKRKRLVRKFTDHGFDGMRCDVDGNLYVTRYGKGTVVKLSPQGKTLQEIDVLGSRPSNICFGGMDGRTVYVTEVDHRRLVQFRVDRPGLAWSRWHSRDTQPDQ